MPPPTDRERVSAALAAPSYTPARRDLALVAELIATGDDKVSTAAQRALLSAGPDDALAALVTAAAGASEAAAARLAGAIGQLARAHPAAPAAATAIATLISMLAPDRGGRAAVLALGKVGGDAARAALCAYADRELPPDHQRALVEALGKVGGPEAEAKVAAFAMTGDPELARRRDRAILMAERDRGRDAESAIRGDVAPPEDLAIACRCRAGLEQLLADELDAAGIPASEVSPGLVRVRGRIPLARFHAARLWISLGIERPLPPGDDLPARLAAALSSARELLTALTDGAIRWRLDFAGGGHRRAVVWKTAQAVRAAAPSLVNDPTATTWDVIVAADDTSIELRPRRLPNPRFAWRVADVSAASHPTIAAALARVAGVLSDDLIWDPFCGSGSELVERGLLGPFARLLGSDLDSRALEAARANLSAAHLPVDLTLADALSFDPGRPSLIITNPPLGRRLRGDPAPLLSAFITRAAALLRPGGRLVWITPSTQITSRAATRARLTLHSRLTVDLGGYDAHLERWHL